MNALENADRLLRLLSRSGPLGLSDISSELSLPRNGILRLVETLQTERFVSLDSNGEVALGFGLLPLATAAERQIPVMRIAQEIMQALRDHTGQTVYLGERRGREVLCLGREPGVRVGLLLLHPGEALPLHAGALSRVLAAHTAGLTDLLSNDPTFDAFTPHTLRGVDDLNADGVQIRERGYSISDEDVTLGIAALGVPIHVAGAPPSIALSVAGLRDEILDRERSLVDELLRASRDIESALREPQ